MHDRTQKSDTSSPAGRSPNQPETTPDNPLMSAAPLNPMQIIQLQGIIGNRQVQRLLNQGRTPIRQRAVPGQVQRKMNVGLITADASGRFVNSAHAYINAPENSQKSIADLAEKLTDLASEELAEVGVPPVKKHIQAGGGYGMFDFQTWTMVLNSDIGAATVGALPPDKAASFVNTIYHEARHAQQTFHIAQVKAGLGRKASEISRLLNIELAVAIKAAARPIKNPDTEIDPDDDEDDEDIAIRAANRAFYAEVNEMHDSVYGVNQHYRRLFVGDVRKNARKIIEACETMTEANVAAKLPAVTATVGGAVKAWQDMLPDIEKERTRLNAIVAKSAADTKMLAHLDTLKKFVLEAVSIWEEVQTRWDDAETAAHMAKLVRCADLLRRDAYDAYVELPEETDAHEVGRAAENQYKAKNAAAPQS